ncbi:MAG: FAD-binding protein [Chloroflexi bacterium]|nr:FAD-binding protein [Chloroflexota bacterium]MCL5075259.1 FAD-binding protein [Chloroflexota bacterium]
MATVKRVDLKTDILILGGGSAGCLAAIVAKSRQPGLDVVVLEKGDITRSGSIALGMDALNIVCLPGLTTPELYVEANRTAVEGILDYKPSYVLAERSYGMLQKLESWGVKFPRDGEGRYRAFQIHPKGRFCVEMDAPDLKVILANKLRQLGVRVLNRTMAVSLLTRGERVVGATALNVRTGEFIVCSAQATILATGGAARFGLPGSGYLYGTADYPGNAGDGYALAFRAGAELTGFEYTMTTPLIKDIHCPLLNVVLTRGGEVVNARGERVERGRISAAAILAEFMAGRGPVFLKMSHLSETEIAEIERILFFTERPLQKRFFQGRGINFRRELVELAPTEFYLCGGHGLSGLVVNDRAETSLEGLFAAGDVASVPRQHLTGAFVFGEIAAENAIALSREVYPADEGQVLQSQHQVVAPWQGGNDRQVTLEQFEYKVRRTINDYLTPPKNKYKLVQGIWWMERFREELEQRAIVRDYHELGKFLEIGFIIDCAQLSATASLAREESRWGLYHHRADFPETDDANWRKHVVLQRGDHDAGIQVSFKSVEEETL